MKNFVLRTYFSIATNFIFLDSWSLFYDWRYKDFEFVKPLNVNSNLRKSLVDPKISAKLESFFIK